MMLQALVLMYQIYQIQQKSQLIGVMHQKKAAKGNKKPGQGRVG